MGTGRGAATLVRVVRSLPANRWVFRGARVAAATMGRLGAEVVIPVRLADGSMVQVDIRGRTEAQAVWAGAYDADLLAFLKAAVTVAGPNVVDVGANVGLLTVPLARHVAPRGGRVLAVEPVAENYAMLRRSIALNELTNVATLPVALGSEPGTVSLRRDAQLGQSTGNAVVDTGTPASGTLVSDVPLRTLDDVVADTGVTWNVVKIDCEGFDVHVVRGARAVMQEQRPIIWGEFHTELTPRFGPGVSSMRGQLTECDYQAFGFTDTFRIVPITLSDGVGNCALVPTELVGPLLHELALLEQDQSRTAAP